jgi:DNA (cytosine-5)-methyltransferase 1
MTHGSLFSGIGGFDLASEWMGWQNVFHCEWNPFGQKVLKHYWPKSISYADICSTDFTIHRGAIDIITGGFPCQPYSTAGKRLGKEDDRHLWPEMLRAIQEIQPKWVVGENVLGLVNWNGGMVFNEVQTDLEAQGYEVQPYVLPSASVNAPHRRDRIFFVAYRNATNTERFRLDKCEDTAKVGGTQAEVGRQGNKFTNAVEADGKAANATDTHGDEFNQRNSKHEKQSGQRGVNALGHTNESNDNGVTTDTEGESGERVRLKFGEFGQPEQEQFRGNCGEVGSKRNAADTSDKGLQRGEVIGGIGGIGQNGNKFPSGGIPPNWEIFPTESPICCRDDGIPYKLDGITFSKWRNESIKAYGNAVVPQVVYQIFKAIQEYENLNP